MNTFLSLILLLVAFGGILSAQVSSGIARHIQWGATLPSVCRPGTGDVFFKTTATVGVYFCSATNTWTIVSQTPGTGITALNADSTSTHTLTVGSAGTDFAISNPGGGNHVLNLPVASSTVTGKLSSSNWTTFNNKVGVIFGRSGPTITAQTGDYTAAQVTNAVDQSGSYSNPAWITGLDAAKINSGTLPIARYINGTPANNDCMKYDTATGKLTSAGAACGAGGGGGLPANCSDVGGNIVCTGPITATEFISSTGGTSEFTFTEGTVPGSNPSAGQQKLWLNIATHGLELLDSSGASTPIGSGGGGLPSGCTSPGSGQITCTGTITADTFVSSSVGTTEFTFTEGTIPANPAATQFKMWVNSATHAPELLYSSGVSTRFVMYDIFGNMVIGARSLTQSSDSYVDPLLAGKAASNAATTVNGQTCTLGSTCTVTANLPANPAACPAGQYASDIAADGTLTCTTPPTNCTSTISSGTDLIGTLAAGTVLCVMGNQTLTAAVTQSNANVAIQCMPGVTITRQTAATNGINWSGDDGRMEGCTLATGNVNDGILLSVTGNRFVSNGLTVTGTGNNGTATVDAAWVVVSGGSGHRFRNTYCPSMVNQCLHFTTTASNMSNVVLDGFRSDMTYDVSTTNHPAALGFYNTTAGRNMDDISVSNVSVTARGTGFALFWGGTANFPTAFRVRSLYVKAQGANQTNAAPLISVFGCDRCSFDQMVAEDAGFTHFNQAAIALHDLHNWTATNVFAYVTSNSGQCFTMLDSTRGVLGPGFCGGAKTNSPTSLATNGWAVGNPGINFESSAPTGAEEDMNIVTGMVILAPPNLTGDAILTRCKNTSAGCNWTKVVNNTIYGAGTATAGTGIRFKADGGSATVTHGYVAGNHIYNLQNGIAVESTAANTVIGENDFDGVTNKIVNAGTGTRINYSGGLPYATWNTSLADGSSGLCTDCTIAACSTAGTGAFIRYAAGTAACW